MAVNLMLSCNSNAVLGFKQNARSNHTKFFGDKHGILIELTRMVVQKGHCCHGKFSVFAATKGSAESSKSEETVPSWAKTGSDEPPPWAREDGKKGDSGNEFEIPFFVYLLASAVTAIAAIGSVFEYVNQKPVFGVVNPDSAFYAPLLGFFAFTGIPTSAFLWFKSVQVANKEAEEQDRRDGYR